MTKETTIRLGIVGASGKMGSLIAQRAVENPAFQGVKTPNRNHFIKAFQEVDVVIDVSHASVTQQHVAWACQHSTPLLIATTGLDHETIQAIEAAGNMIPILWAPNTSWGICVLKHLASVAAEWLGDDYDIEIMEAHHRYKQDKPSGTALALKAAINKRNLVSKSQISPQRDIGIASIRGGHVVGEHAVHFMGGDDKLTLSHTALHRDCFANGALKIAAWLANQSKGLYQPEDAFSSFKNG